MANDDYDVPSPADAEASYQAEQAAQGSDALSAKNAQDREWFNAGDIALAIPRGVVHAGEDVLNLIPGVDLHARPFGESTSVAGGLLEGAATFAAGFIPISGWLGRAGKVGELLNLTNEAEKGFEVAKSTALLSGETAAAAAAGRKALATRVGRGLAAGALTDFAVWDGHDQRLSNLIQDYPALANPITEFLAAKPDDSQIVGRLKGALEGLGLGAMTEAVILGVKGLRAAKAVRDAGGSLEEANAAAAKAAPPEKIKAAYDAGFDNAPETPRIPVRQELTDAITALQRGEIDHAAFEQKVTGLRDALDERAANRPLPPDRLRGPDIWLERLQQAQRREDLTPETVGFAKWLINKTPQVTEGLGVSVRRQPDVFAGAGGNYSPHARVATLFKGAANDGTAVHEILHHTERMMPEEVQKGIRQAWLDDVLSELRKAQAAGNTERAEALNNVIQAVYTGRGEEEVRGLFQSGTLSYEDYHLSNPSEFWAVNATRLLKSRYEAGSWIEKAAVWLRELGEKAKSALGLQSDAPVLKGLDSVLNGEGSFQSKKMLSARKAYEDIQNPGAAESSFQPQGTPAGPDRRGYILRWMGLDPAKLDVLHEKVANPAVDPFVENPTTLTNPRTMDPISRLVQGLKSTNMNLRNFSSENAGEFMRATEALFKNELETDIKSLDTVGYKEQTAAALQRTTDMLGLPNTDVLAARLLGPLGDELEKFRALSVKVRALDFTLQVAADGAAATLKEYTAVSRGLATGDADRLLLKAVEQSQLAMNLHALALGFRAEYGRGLGAYNIKVPKLDIPPMFRELATGPQDIKEALERAGGRDKVAAWADKASAAFNQQGAVGLYKVGRASIGRRTLDMTIEYWMNAVLAGPKTAVVNVLGPSLNMIYLPLERSAGAILRMGGANLRGDAAGAAAASDVLHRAVREAMETLHSVPEAFTFAKALWNGEKETIGRERWANNDAITSANIGLQADSVAGKAIDWLGQNFIRVPTRFLSASDEFLKQLKYRGTARANLYYDALQQGVPHAEIPALVHDQMEKMIYKGQVYSKGSVFKRGLEDARAKGVLDDTLAGEHAREYLRQKQAPGLDGGPSEFERFSVLSDVALKDAQEATFTSPAEPGTFVYGLQKLITEHPYLRFVAPFINTPVNILRFTLQRSDVVGSAKALAALQYPPYAKALTESKNRMVMDMLSGDARRQASATGRMSLGLTAGLFIYSKAADGTLTGKGPTDPGQRRTLEAAGWQQYSIKVGNAYYSYARLDPFATLLGTYADFAEYIKAAGGEDQVAGGSIIGGLAVAMANNFTNKSYLTGISNFIEMLQDPDRKWNTFAQRFAGSFVPNIAGQAVLAGGDDNVRDVRSIADAFANKIPGVSSSLPPQRNVLGEPIQRVKAAGTDTIGRWVDLINPVAYREVSDDLVKREMATPDLKHGFVPPPRTQNGIDLTTVKVGATNAYDRWGELQGTIRIGGLTLKDALRKKIMSPAYQKLTSLSSDGLESPRVIELNRIINEYRHTAYEKLLAESPDLNAYSRAFARQKRAVRAGAQPSIIPQPGS